MTETIHTMEGDVLDLRDQVRYHYDLYRDNQDALYEAECRLAKARIKNE